MMNHMKHEFWMYLIHPLKVQLGYLYGNRYLIQTQEENCISMEDTKQWIRARGMLVVKTEEPQTVKLKSSRDLAKHIR